MKQEIMNYMQRKQKYAKETGLFSHMKMVSLYYAID